MEIKVRAIIAAYKAGLLTYREAARAVRDTLDIL